MASLAPTCPVGKTFLIDARWPKQTLSYITWGLVECDIDLKLLWASSSSPWHLGEMLSFEHMGSFGYYTHTHAGPVQGIGAPPVEVLRNGKKHGRQLATQMMAFL